MQFFYYFSNIIFWIQILNNSKVPPFKLESAHTFFNLT
jgi:hypothetical protein